MIMRCTRIALALVSLTFASTAFGQNTADARSKYDRLRAQAGQSCNGLTVRDDNVTCTDWTALAGCLSAAARTQGETCTTFAQAASEAFDSATAVCGAQTSDLKHARSEAARLRTELAACLNRPQPAAAAPTAPAPAAPPAPRLVTLPVCLHEQSMGGATLVCATHDGRTLRGAACHHVARADIVRAGCACAAGTAPVRLASGNGVFCAAIGPHGEQIRPTGVVAVGEGNLARRVATLEERYRVLSARVDEICSHVTTEGARSSNCAEMNTLLNSLFVNASGNGGVMDESAFNAFYERLYPRLAAQLHRERTGAFRFFAGVEGGQGVFTGLTPVYGLLGIQARARLTSVFHLYGEGGGLMGSYGAAQVSGITGYFFGGGVGFEFPAGVTTLNIDVGFAMRSYAESGVTQAANAGAVGVFGDYRGRVYGGQLALSVFLFHGLGISGSLFVGTGDAVIGTDVPNQFAQVGGGTSVLGSFRAFYEF